MPEPIIYDQVLKDDYIQLVCLYTKLQYDSVPTTYPQLVESALDRDFINLERDLLNHPLTNIHMHFAILARLVWGSAVLYGLADPDIKNRMRLHLRDTFRAVQHWPKAWRDACEPMWAQWLDVLNEEEEERAYA